LPFTTTAQDGTDGATVVFDVEHFEAVAEIMQPRRRRRLSPEARQRLVEAGAKTRFGHGAHDAGAAPESKVGLRVVFWVVQGANSAEMGL
jgi:hypothetical protein